MTKPTILLILINSSGEEAHGGNSTLPTEVPSSWCPNLYSLSLDNISGKKNSSGINSYKKKNNRILHKRTLNTVINGIP